LTALAPFGTNTLIAFKEQGAYTISGQGMASLRIQLQAGLPGCDSPDSVSVGDQNIVWLNAATKKMWLWNGDTVLIELTQPIASLEDSTVQNLTLAQSLYWNQRLYLRYDKSGDAATYGNYIEWDFQLVTQYPMNPNLAMPSATIGDMAPGKVVAISSATDTPYAFSGQGLHKIHGKGATIYNNETVFADRTMQVTLPDVPIKAGTWEGAVDQLYVQEYVSAALSGTPNLTFTPRVNCVDQTAITVAVTATSGAAIDQQYRNLSTVTANGSHLGGSFSAPILTWTEGNVSRSIERIILFYNEKRELARQ
jgi:hypothetical protein